MLGSGRVGSCADLSRGWLLGDRHAGIPCPTGSGLIRISAAAGPAAPAVVPMFSKWSRQLDSGRSSAAGTGPRTFVVNLAREKARRAAIESQLDTLGLEYEIVDAVDGRALTPELESQVDRGRAERRLGEPLLPGEIGCALSHQKIYRRMLECGLDSAVVLEDDALLGAGFADIVRQLARSAEDLVLLHHCYSFSYAWWRLWRPAVGEHRLLPCTRTPCSTVAYYLTTKAATTLLREGLPVRGRADWPLPIGRALGAKLVHPAIAFHDPRYDSDVRERDYPTSNRLTAYLEALSFVPYLRHRERYDSLAGYVVGRLLSRCIYHAPPQPGRLATEGWSEQRNRESKRAVG